MVQYIMPTNGKLRCEHNGYTLQGFIQKASEVHNCKYTYENTEYHNCFIEVAITCPIHGIFFQKPAYHIAGRGCTKCGRITTDVARLKTKEQFIIDANTIHLGKYNYSKINYIGARKKIEITCPIHGLFTQRPNDHLNGRGCPKCSDSVGERLIKKILLENSIKFTEQKRYNDCRGKKFPLSFDFYLDDYNSLVEFDGQTHYEIVYNEEVLERTKRHDQIKNDYCLKNNIPLLRIPYLRRKDIPKLIGEFIGLDIKTYK
jgi:hypothetical protein